MWALHPCWLYLLGNTPNFKMLQVLEWIDYERPGYIKKYEQISTVMHFWSHEYQTKVRSANALVKAHWCILIIQSHRKFAYIHSYELYKVWTPCYQVAYINVERDFETIPIEFDRKNTENDEMPYYRSLAENRKIRRKTWFPTNIDWFWSFKRHQSLFEQFCVEIAT